MCVVSGHIVASSILTIYVTILFTLSILSLLFNKTIVLCFIFRVYFMQQDNDFEKVRMTSIHIEKQYFKHNQSTINQSLSESDALHSFKS